MLRKTWMVAALAGSSLMMSSQLCRAADNPDSSFVAKASVANKKEVETSTVAESKATNAEVKAFAKHMVADHTQAMGEMNELVAKKGITLSNDDKDVTSAVEKLNKENAGADFDKAYMSMMVSDHKKTVKLFEKEAKSGEDADFKALAEKLLPTLQGHLKMAQDLSDKEKTEKTSGSTPAAEKAPTGEKNAGVQQNSRER